MAKEKEDKEEVEEETEEDPKRFYDTKKEVDEFYSGRLPDKEQEDASRTEV